MPRLIHEERDGIHGFILFDQLEADCRLGPYEGKHAWGN